MGSEPKVVRKVVRSWFIQNVGWFALNELSARILLEAAFVVLLGLLGLHPLAILLGWLGFHTLVWLAIYGGFSRTWVLSGHTTDVGRLKQFADRAAERVSRDPSIDVGWLRGSLARGALRSSSDIDFLLVPGPHLLARVRGVAFVWGLRAWSVARRIPLQARMLDVERYVAYHTVGEQPVPLKPPRRPENWPEKLIRRGLLIAFSGVDGSGKTTIATRVVSLLQKRGYQASYFYGHRQAWYVRDEPPEFSLAIGFESIWKDIGRSFEDLEEHPGARFLYDLLTAMDYLYVRWILTRSLMPNRVVVSDRYVADVLAYLRSWGPMKITLEGLLVGASFEPDLAILFKADPATAYQRKGEWNLKQIARFDQEYAKLEPVLGLERVNANAPSEEVLAEVESVIEHRLGIYLAEEPPGGGG